MERKGSGIPGRKQSGMPFLEIRRSVPMWTFLTSFRERYKILRKVNGIPDRKQSNLANFSATEEECTLWIFLIILRRDVLNGERKMPDVFITMKKIWQTFWVGGNRLEYLPTLFKFPICLHFPYSTFWKIKNFYGMYTPFFFGLQKNLTNCSGLLETVKIIFVWLKRV